MQRRERSEAFRGRRCSRTYTTCDQIYAVSVIREGKVFLVLANLILASFQKKMGQNVGVKPGDEMLAAIRVAGEMNIPTSMVDRPVQTTLRRAWAKNGFMGKMGLLASLFGGAFSNEEIDESEIEALKEKNA